MVLPLSHVFSFLFMNQFRWWLINYIQQSVIVSRALCICELYETWECYPYSVFEKNNKMSTQPCIRLPAHWCWMLRIEAVNKNAINLICSIHSRQSSVAILMKCSTYSDFSSFSLIHFTIFIELQEFYLTPFYRFRLF